MNKHKRLVKTWLSDFVEVLCELSDANFRLSVYSGLSILNAPKDIFDTLRRRGVLEYSETGRFYFVTFDNDTGTVMVTVRADSSLKNGLVLTVPE